MSLIYWVKQNWPIILLTLLILLIVYLAGK